MISFKSTIGLSHAQRPNAEGCASDWGKQRIKNCNGCKTIGSTSTSRHSISSTQSREKRRRPPITYTPGSFLVPAWHSRTQQPITVPNLTAPRIRPRRPTNRAKCHGTSASKSSRDASCPYGTHLRDCTLRMSLFPRQASPRTTIAGRRGPHTVRRRTPSCTSKDNRCHPSIPAIPAIYITVCVDERWRRGVSNRKGRNHSSVFGIGPMWDPFLSLLIGFYRGTQ